MSSPAWHYRKAASESGGRREVVLFIRFSRLRFHYAWIEEIALHASPSSSNRGNARTRAIYRRKQLVSEEI